MRAELAKLPDGVHTFTDYIDGVGVEPTPIPICVRVEIAGDEVLISFEGTSPQVDASVNCPVGMVRAACYCAIRGIGGGEIPNCEGYMVPIRIDAPAGTVVNPVLPAACGARGVIGYRVYDALMGALAPIVPDRVLAAGEGGPTLIAFGGYDEQRRPFGRPRFSSAPGARGPRGTGSKASRIPLRTSATSRSSSSRPTSRSSSSTTDSARLGGAGRQRGGLAYVRSFRVRTPRVTLTIRTDRRDHPPYGLAGGKHGAPSSNVVESAAGQPRTADDADGSSQLVAGDRFTHVAAGGGGYGDPVRARPASGARGRARREGLVSRRPRPVRRRDRGRRGSTPRRPPLLRSAAMSVDLAIRNGLVVDGTGGEPLRAAVGVKGERIVEIGEVPEAATRDRRRGQGRRAGFRRHPQPLRLHAAGRPARGERRAPGRHARGHRELRLRLLPPARTRRSRRRRSTGTPTTSRSPGIRPRTTSSARAGGPAINVASLAPNGQIRLVGRRARRPPGPARRAGSRCATCSTRHSSRAPWGSRPASSMRPSVAPTRTSSLDVRGLRPP